MSAFKQHEERILDLLVAGTLSNDQLEAVKSDGVITEYQYTGCGYFLTVKHPCLPVERIVFDSPLIVGKANGIVSGYVIIIETNALTLECHDWGVTPIPPNFRDMDVLISKDIPA